VFGERPIAVKKARKSSIGTMQPQLASSSTVHETAPSCADETRTTRALGCDMDDKIIRPPRNEWDAASLVDYVSETAFCSEDNGMDA